MTPLKEFKLQAIRLRRQGLSYNEIRRHVPVVKSTLSLWLKSIPLSEKHRKRLYTKQIAILSRGPQSQKERRAREIEKIIQTAAEEITRPLSDDTYRLVGAALYWAEGTKRGGFEVTNSDPYFILFMVRWIEKIFGVPAPKLKARLNIYPQQNDMKIKKFWSALTGIPTKNFGKSFVKPLNKGYKKNNLYYGTIKIELPKGTDTKHRVFGWIRAVLDEIEPQVKGVQQKWIRLASVARPVNLK
ncbi:MAG: hypothetical protein HYS44_02645 [Candidatus Niyogibacteria bacterium]|nr:hypothetical protein [Candidatus Niyogibacteria bacterium]